MGGKGQSQSQHPNPSPSPHPSPHQSRDWQWPLSRDVFRGANAAMEAIEDYQEKSHALKLPLYEDGTFTEEDDEVMHKATMYNLGSFAIGSAGSFGYIQARGCRGGGAGGLLVNAAVSVAAGACALAGMSCALSYTGQYNKWLLSKQHSRLADCVCDNAALLPLKTCAQDPGCNSALGMTSFLCMLERCKQRDQQIGIGSHWYAWRTAAAAAASSSSSRK
jgi:hypothetical protein